MSAGAGLAGPLVRLGRGGLTVAQEAADVALLGPLLWARQRRDPTASRLAGAVRDRWYLRTWTAAARAVGARIEEGPGALLTVSRAERSLRIWGPFLSLDDPVTLRLAGDKPATHALLRRAGLRVPEHVVVELTDARAAVRLLERGERVVIKPAASTGAGRGVTGGIGTPRDVRRALLRSGPHDPRRALAEEQSSGEEVRVLVLLGEPVAVVRRRAPVVVGDGVATIAELVRTENRRRLEANGAAGLFALSIDLDAVIALREAGRSPRTVPAVGQRVRVKSATSQGSERDATAVDLDDPAVRGVVADAADAARALDADFVSVEFITPDPSRTTSETGVVLEVNTTPGIAQHYVVDNPDTTPDVAQLLLDRLLT